MKKLALSSVVFAGLQSMAAAQEEITEDAAVVIMVCIIIIFVLISLTLFLALLLVLCKGVCHRGKVCPLSSMDTTVKKKRGKEFSELPGRQALQQYPQGATPKLTIMSRDLSGDTEMVSYDHRPYGLASIPESATVISNLGAGEFDRGKSGSGIIPGTPDNDDDGDDEGEVTEI